MLSPFCCCSPGGASKPARAEKAHSSSSGSSDTESKQTDQILGAHLCDVVGMWWDLSSLAISCKASLLACG